MASIEEDQHVFMRDVSWTQLETMLEIKGEDPCPRIAYAGETLELRRPCRLSEFTRKSITRLIEAFAVTQEIELQGYGSTLLKDKERGIAAEPDECYVLGVRPFERPDLVIEVHGFGVQVDRLAVWHGLGVAEVWAWQDARMVVRRREERGYALASKSVLLPDLDLKRMAQFVGWEDQTRAVRRFLA